MECDVVRKKFELLDSGVLPPAEEEALKGHAESCGECRIFMEEASRVGDLLRVYVEDELKGVPPNAVLSRVEASIDELDESRKRTFRFFKFLIPAFIGVVALLIIMIYPSFKVKRIEKPGRFTVSIESIEAENATVVLVDKGADTPKVIWIIERGET
jgi:predicted anti-sigma-YlaC factor YlaD